MKHIKDSILKEAYFKTSFTCPQCKYKIKGNGREEYQQKQKALKILLKETACQRTDVRGFLEDDFESLFFNIRSDKHFQDTVDTQGRFYDLEDTPAGALTALQRLCYIASVHHFNGGTPWKAEEKERFLKGVAHYGKIEADRTDLGNTRFHKSIFCLPKCMIHIYFALYPDLSQAGYGKRDSVYENACREIFRVAIQAWTLPLREDHTDEHPISPERFRGHVWWVGANALQYRPTLLCAMLYGSVEMMDTLVCVAKNALYPVTCSTERTAFWSEGICADGFGWGHGRQTYNNGYPSDGILAALDILKAAKGTPWEDEIEQTCFDWVIHYLHGITWSDYKNAFVPMQSRHSFLRRYRRNTSSEYAYQIAESLSELKEWLTSKQQDDIEAVLKNGAAAKAKTDANVRWFQNNDTLIRKTDGMYLFINCASSRCDGVECAGGMADRRNFYIADGSCLIMKDGTEYEEAYGTWQVSMIPGVTERELFNHEILPEENWRGYHSKSGFCGAVQDEDSGVMGFIYEKNVDIKVDGKLRQEGTFTRAMAGVYAHKGYFIHGDMAVFLGAGIYDKKPEYGHRIRTTVNNTGRVTDAVIIRQEGRYKAKKHERLQIDRTLTVVEQNGIRYGFFPGFFQEVEIISERRKTDWLDMNGDNRGVEDRETEIFELFIDHGTAPQAAQYAYFIDCGRNPVPQVISNTQALQAVLWQKDLVQAVFYTAQAALCVFDIEICVSEPVVMQVKKQEAGIRIELSDPYQEKLSVKVTVKTHKGISQAQVVFPQRYEEGKSTQIDIGL